MPQLANRAQIGLGKQQVSPPRFAPVGTCCFLLSTLGPAYRQKELFYLPPAGNPVKTGHFRVVRSRKEDPLPLEAFKVPERVVDQIVGAENALVSAEDEVSRWNKRKMAPQPTVFGAEGVRKLHGRRGDKNLVVLDQFGKHFLTVLKNRQILEKVFASKVAFQSLVAV